MHPVLETLSGRVSQLLEQKTRNFCGVPPYTIFLPHLTTRWGHLVWSLPLGDSGTQAPSSCGSAVPRSLRGFCWLLCIWQVDDKKREKPRGLGSRC